MGRPLAVNLAGAGVPVLGWNRSQQAREAAAAAGVTVVEVVRAGRQVNCI